MKLTDKQQQLRALASGSAKNLLAVGGSRSGKTFGLCYFIDRRAWKAPGSRHLILRRHGVAAKTSIGMDTFPKMLRLQGLGEAVQWHKQDGYFEYPNGSEVWLAGLDDTNIDKVLGKEYATLYANEASELSFPVFEQVQTRLAQKVDEADGVQTLPLKIYVDLNPTTTTHWTYKLWFEGINPVSEERVDPADYVSLFVNPHDNIENLPDGFVDDLAKLSAAQKKRFLLGQYAADSEFGLWRRSMFKRVERLSEDLRRVVVAIDPAVSTKVGSDETGIVVAGISAGTTPKVYVLEDTSGRFKPEEWARVALNAYRTFEADCIVAEVNQGGDMVESTLRACEAQMNDGRPPARVKMVHATKGKYVRAEPIAGLYERGLVYHVGEFPALEDQMCSYTVDFDRKEQGYSPDRMDALVWGITDLFPRVVKKDRHEHRSTYSPKPREF